MTSAAALRALCGKSGAAKKALLELDATNVHGHAAAAAEALGDGVPLEGDDDEDLGDGPLGDEDLDSSDESASSVRFWACLSCCQRVIELCPDVGLSSAARLHRPTHCCSASCWPAHRLQRWQTSLERAAHAPLEWLSLHVAGDSAG